MSPLADHRPLMHFVWAFVQPHAWAGVAGDGFVRALVGIGLADCFARAASVWVAAPRLSPCFGHAVPAHHPYDGQAARGHVEAGESVEV
ncbi:hypothetical protein WBK31_23505 [Nonomuraea sp. N2-4H]|uniref:hypothetical protein n=1 Tax=Nonomuraea sp. N2-4H TaxID=3128898 RepID=UPI00324AFEB7